MNSDQEIVPSLLCDVSNLNAPKNLVLVNNWQHPYCWIVKMGEMGVLLPHGGDAEHYEAVIEMPDKIRPREIVGWRPSKFGTNPSIDLTLREDSHLADQDLFGQEMTIQHDKIARKCMVVNQQGFLCTFIASSLSIPRAAC